MDWMLFRRLILLNEQIYFPDYIDRPLDFEDLCKVLRAHNESFL